MNKLKKLILKLAIRYIVKTSKNNNYIKHATNEYKITFPNYIKDEMQYLMFTQLIELLSILATHGDSGTSIEYKLNHLNKLINFEPLSKLTFKDDEFEIVYNNVYQNIRNSKVFKKDDKYFYNDSFIKNARYYIGQDNKIIIKNGGSWNGALAVLFNNGDIKYFSNDYIKDISKFNGQSFRIDTYEIEYPEDWWISVCKEEDLKDYLEYYTPIYNDERLEKELNFKDKKYRKEILEKIELIKKHNN